MNGYGEAMLARLTRLTVILALAVLAIGGLRQTYKNTSQRIAARPLALDVAQPNRRQVGQMSFLGAWELRSDNQDFGGISALVALSDGRFVGVGDAGTLIGFGLSQDSKVDRPFIASLPGAFGKDISFKDRDSEGIAYDPASGRIWVSYENRAAIRRFPPSLARVDGVVRPAEMQRWSKNKGAEALVRLRDGRFIAFSEGKPGENNAALLFSGDPVEPGTTSFRFRYHAPAGYRMTDATQLADGRLLLLFREIGFPDGFTAKLALLDPATITRDSLVKGQIIATLAPPLLVDNMEGITTTQEDGRTIVWIISDDNFSIFQRTLLMKFALAEGNKKPEADNAPGFDSL